MKTVIVVANEIVPPSVSTEDSAMGDIGDERSKPVSILRESKLQIRSSFWTDYALNGAKVPSQHQSKGRRRTRYGRNNGKKCRNLPSYDGIESQSSDSTSMILSDLRSRLQAEKEDETIELIEFKLRRRGSKRPRPFERANSQKEEVARNYDIVLDELTGKRSVMEKKVAPIHQRSTTELQKCRRSTILRRNPTTASSVEGSVFAEMAAVAAEMKASGTGNVSPATTNNNNQTSLAETPSPTPSPTQMRKAASELSQTHRAFLETPKRKRRERLGASFLEEDEKNKLLETWWLHQDGLEADHFSPLKSTPKERLPFIALSEERTTPMNINSEHSETASNAETFAQQYTDDASIKNQSERPSLQRLAGDELGSIRSFASETSNHDTGESLDPGAPDIIETVPSKRVSLLATSLDGFDSEDEEVGESDGDWSPSTVMADIASTPSKSKPPNQYRLAPAATQTTEESSHTGEEGGSDFRAEESQASGDLGMGLEGSHNSNSSHGSSSSDTTLHDLSDEASKVSSVDDADSVSSHSLEPEIYKDEKPEYDEMEIEESDTNTKPIAQEQHDWDSLEHEDSAQSVRRGAQNESKGFLRESMTGETSDCDAPSADADISTTEALASQAEKNSCSRSKQLNLSSGNDALNESPLPRDAASGSEDSNAERICSPPLTPLPANGFAVVTLAAAKSPEITSDLNSPQSEQDGSAKPDPATSVDIPAGLPRLAPNHTANPKKEKNQNHDQPRASPEVCLRSRPVLRKYMELLEAKNKRLQEIKARSGGQASGNRKSARNNQGGRILSAISRLGFDQHSTVKAINSGPPTNFTPLDPKSSKSMKPWLSVRGNTTPSQPVQVFQANSNSKNEAREALFRAKPVLRRYAFLKNDEDGHEVLQSQPIDTSDLDKKGRKAMSKGEDLDDITLFATPALDTVPEAFYQSQTLEVDMALLESSREPSYVGEIEDVDEDIFNFNASSPEFDFDSEIFEI